MGLGYALFGFLHNVFTVIWVGGLTILVLTIIPTVKKTITDNKQARQLMHGIVSRQRIWVYICMIGLFVTGAAMGKANPNASGFMTFDSTYNILASIKHILTFLMIIVALVRSQFFLKKQAKKPENTNLGTSPIIVNFVLGMLVLLLSSLMAVF